MKKLIFSIVALCACAGTASAAETVLVNETFASGQGAFTIENVNLPSSTDYVWNFSDSYMKASAYISSRSYAADSWLISPTIDTRNMASLTITFGHAARFQKGDLTDEFQLLVAKNPSSSFNAAEWTKLTIPTMPTAGSWTFVSSGNIDLSDYVGVANMRIAFRYKSTAAAADTWYVKNVKIVADVYDEGEAFYVYNSDGTTIGHKIAKADSISFTRPGYSTIIPTGAIDGHDYIDLGLPSGILWATCNVGATSPEEYGDYYAWGETTTKEFYTWSGYKYSSDYALTKYCSQSSFGKDGFTNDLTTLEAADDAATANWGGKWRMPTIDEWDELINNCDWTLIYNYNGTGIAGHIVVSRTNGNSIFLPAAGYCKYNEPLGVGYSGDYWTSSFDANIPNFGWYEGFRSACLYGGDCERCYGLSVRPVYAK